MPDVVSVEVVFATPEKQALLSLQVPSGASLQEAIELSGILKQFPEIDLTLNKVGVWSRAGKLTDSIQSGDRIEIYRPLIADPKDMRRRRAEKAKEEGRADKVTGGAVRGSSTAASE